MRARSSGVSGRIEMRLIQILAAIARLKLARYSIKAARWFAAMGERLYRF